MELEILKNMCFQVGLGLAQFVGLIHLGLAVGAGCVCCSAPPPVPPPQVGCGGVLPEVDAGVRAMGLGARVQCRCGRGGAVWKVFSCCL